MSITQLLLMVFLIFALSRVLLRFKSSEVSLNGLIFWSFVFGLAILVVIFPKIASTVAQTLGIGRGADAVVYVSITLLFYLVFRLYVYLQDVKYKITELVQKLALKGNDRLKNDKKTSKN